MEGQVYTSRRIPADSARSVLGFRVSVWLVRDSVPVEGFQTFRASRNASGFECGKWFDLRYDN